MKRALVSVYDKTGIVDFAKALVEQGFEVLSTGGTQKTLEDAGLSVTGVSDVTGFPECLDGRVKTLHPMIHAGLLAVRDNPEHMKQIEALGVSPIDLVVISLYPFLETISKPGTTFEECIEQIDIGGPTMLRAAAKNGQDVAVVVDPADYGVVLKELSADGAVSQKTKAYLRYKVFAHTAQYDALISQYLFAKLEEKEAFPEKLTLTFDKAQDMRYGENPHQAAAFYKEPGQVAGSLAGAKQLQGKELSYNNINDANGALELLREFDTIAAVAVKHANPCGVGLGETVFEAYEKAYDADPMSIFGGIVAVNGKVDAKTAQKMAEIFLEIIIAPAYEPEALAILSKKKNLRVLELDTSIRTLPAGALEMRKVIGGLLVQSPNNILLDGEPKVVTKRAPNEQEMADLMLAWRIVKHTKSNGIALAKNGQSLGIGPGQVNRIWATEAAVARSGEKIAGAALASDAFFPFDDCVEAACKAGVTAIIHPGGAKQDQLSVDKADEYGAAMLMTGIRHFKH